MKEILMTEKITEARPLNINLNFRIFGIVGLILTLIYAFLGRGLYFRPELLTAVMMIGFLAFITLMDVLVRGETQLFKEKIDYLIVILPLFYLMAAFNAVDKSEAIVGVLKNGAYMLMFLIATQLIRSWQAYRFILETINLIGVLIAIIGLLSATGHVTYPGAVLNQALLSTLQYKNALGIFLAMTALVSFSLWSTVSQSPFKSLYYLFAQLVFNIGILGTQSRAVWVLYPVLILLLAYGFGKEHRIKMLINVCYVLIASTLVSRVFFRQVERGYNEDALFILIGGILLSAAGWILMYRVNRFIKRQPFSPAVRKFWQTLSVGYLVVVLAAYAIYAVNSLPGGWNAVVPEAVTEKAATVTGGDPNFQARIQQTTDALKIAKDFLWSGTGAGGWATLYTKYREAPYVSREVHNSYANVLVETGVIGFSLYLGIWLSTIYSGYRLYKHFRKNENWALIWGILVALIGMCLHSGFDFDLAIPALSLLTWLCFALIRTARFLAHREKTPWVISGTQRWLVFVGAMGIILLFNIPAYRLYNAGKIGAQGAIAMEAGDIVVAEQKLRQAMVLDPYSASYVMDLAKIQIVKWLQVGDKEQLKQGLMLAEEAARKNPSNLEIKGTLTTVYLLADMSEEATKYAEEVITANPMEIKAYEVLAGAGIKGALYQTQKGQLARSLIYLNKVTNIPGRLETVRDEVAKASGKAYRYSWFMQMTPQLNLSVGQAYLLLNQSDKSASFLEKAVTNTKTAPEAAVWLALAYKTAKNDAKYNSIMNTWTKKDKTFVPLYQQVEKILQK